MKRYALLLTAALGMAAAQTPSAPAQATAANASRLADPGLTGASVTFALPGPGSDMTSRLLALAMSAGYEILLEPGVNSVLRGEGGDVPSSQGAAPASPAQVSYSFVQKPFNEVWPLVLDLYGLSYETLRVGGKPVLRVSAKPVQRIVKLPGTLSAPLVERQLKLSFGTLKTVSNSQSNAASSQGASSSTTETTREEVVLDSPTMRIIAEPASNSVIIRGTNQEVAQVQRLLDEIVAVQPPAVRTVPAPAPAAPTPDVQRVYSVKGQQADITALLGAQYPALKVTPVGQTGQLVITGQPIQLDTALTLLAQVDRAAPPPQAGPQTVQRVFQLINASAEEVKATLEGTLAREVSDQGGIGQNLTSLPTTLLDVNGNPINLALPPASGTGAGGTTAGTPGASTTGAATRPAAEAVTLIADKRTNTLIARGTEAQVRQIAELIPQLDQVVPQVNVQVRIQEVTEDASRSLGVDWKVGFGGFNVTLGGGGLGASFDPTRSLMGFNIFPTLQAQETQGLSKQVYDGSITMQSGQRSLGAGGSTQNSSNGAAATIKSGGRLELNIPSGAANVPPIQKQIDYGVNLDFFDPQVAPDGTITVRVRGQVNTPKSTITPSSVPNVLDFANSEAQTTITFKNGQTVLLSGLLGNTETSGKQGTPFLSSLPVIGGLFGKQSTTKKATQLLVVITGSVVK
ncbi:type II secretion system protein GspD [Deinococcus planocerae]|uniref:type II secretion system protein GspD n=1 Tax=Deinococcus planocerae TaxID=1737569 RepID=UPI000C7F2691|nr:secretin N-terminal domain-containing protein [Deinococcus planocerae]